MDKEDMKLMIDELSININKKKEELDKITKSFKASTTDEEIGSYKLKISIVKIDLAYMIGLRANALVGLSMIDKE